jgi:iron(III) transport system substrate-binding protein
LSVTFQEPQKTLRSAWSTRRGPAGTLPAHQQYVTTTLDVFVQAYNTEKVKREELPKTFEDLLDPRWQGRLWIEATDKSWFGTLLETIGEAKGEKLFRDIAAGNGISVRRDLQRRH